MSRLEAGLFAQAIVLTSIFRRSRGWYGTCSSVVEAIGQAWSNRMHIVVCIKQVPDSAQIRVHPVTNTIMRQGVPAIVNPYDLFALEEALRLKDQFGGRVTMLCMGPPQAEDALRKCISFGATDAILVTDRAFAGADTLAT